ncbi:hypothetical protein C4579_02695, partial [Candidatus Microgenomates bacterium]
MTGREINLIFSKRELTSQEQVLQKINRVWVPVVLGIFLLFVSSTFVYALILNSQINAIDEGITIEKTAIAAKEQDEGLYLLIKQKISMLQRVIASRYPYHDLATFFLSQQTDNVRISSLKLGNDNNII